MTSRLDRLVLLLDTGSTAVVRNTAAQQIGDVQRQHPSELYNLLARVVVHLRSKSWETRTAAALAVAAIASNVCAWEPAPVFADAGAAPLDADAGDDRLAFAAFDLARVVAHAAPLLASGGAEFDVGGDAAALNAKDRVLLQKKLVKQRLGLESQFMDVDLVNEQDLKLETTASQKSENQAVVPKQLLEIGKSTGGDDENLEGLSARERNARKRKAKLEAKRSSGKTDKVWAADLSSSSSSKKQKLDPVSTPTSATAPTAPATASDGKIVVEHKTKEDHALSLGILGSNDEWPFEGLCEQLCIDLFNPRWEVRHGAALGLMEVIKHHGSGAGKITGVDRATNQKLHEAWLEDVSIRILCVLALDRFADYVDDSLRVPVRETCARVLGVLMQKCDSVLSFKVLEEGLLKLIDASKAVEPASSQSSALVVPGTKKGKAKVTSSPPTSTSNIEWEMRHAALIGLKYWMAVKRDLVKDVLVPKSGSPLSETGAFIAILNGLKDHNDDVRAVSSSTLLPICDLLVTLLPPQKVYSLIVTSLWNTLQELDDLTAATSSIMDLLSQLLMKTEIRQLMHSEPASSLQANVPRLYPFFRHAITSVRVAVLKTILSLLDILTAADGASSSCAWITPELLRLVFQNFILEDRKDIVGLTLNLWTQLLNFMGKVQKRALLFLPCIESWFTLLMTPIGSPLDLSLFYDYSLGRKGGSGGGGLNVSIQDQAMVQQDLHVVDEQDVLRGRLSAATGVGRLLNHMIATPGIEAGSLSIIQGLLFGYLNSGSAGHRTLVHIIIEELSISYYSDESAPESITTKFPLLKGAWDTIMANLISADSVGGSQVMYSEQLPPLGRLRMECQALINTFAEYGASGCPFLPNLPFTDTTQFPPNPTNPFGMTFTFQVAERLLNEVVPQLFPMVKPTRSGIDPTPLIKERITRVQIAIEKYHAESLKWETQTHASASSAIVNLRSLPPKLNPIVRSLMGSIKSETSELIQRRSASGVGRLLELNSGSGKGGMDKVVKNLGVYLCNEAEWGDVFSVTSETGILSLGMSEKQAEVEVKSGSGGGGKKSKELNSEALSAVESASGVIADLGVLNKVKNQVARRGAKFAFEQTCLLFGSTVFDRLPKLWEIMTTGVTEFSVEANVVTDLDPAAIKCKADPVFAQTVVDSLVTLATIVDSVDRELLPKLCSTLLRPVCRVLRTPLTVSRHAAGLCVAAFAKTCTPETIKAMVENVVPLLGDAAVVRRQGAIECIQLVIANLEESRLLPYIVFLIVPVLGRMSDADESVRLVSTSVFAHLVKLVPLESGVADPEGMDSELVKLKQEERKFMGQLVGSEKVESFEIPKGIDAELRPYQKEGVSWLAFLNRYGLHGILCDDMGLGKTLQSICMLASDHHIRAAKFEETGSPEFAHIPSLVVCPPTLTGHWRQEILQYAGKVLKPMIYVGGPAERNRLRALIPSHDVIITSYEILRNDVENLTAFTYNYCILDEGHVIKNAKTKLTKAVKTVDCKNRLILSGTPVQNNVLELWSLFDFLMPGFLGTETQFQAKFGKPILASRDAKSSSREQERGALALEALHKQVLPFLMRRMKEDVLDDLPPKIIQDFYVELGDVQKQLYEDFGKSQTGAGVASQVKASGSGSGKGKTGETHVFQALQYLRKLCNHPSLVLKPDHPKFGMIMDQLKADGKTIHDVSLSPKIMALKQILQDCGIGATEGDESKTNDTAPVTAPHRVLVFCQLREMLDHIESGLFKTHMKSVTYLRMDGTTDTSVRHEMVQKFNSDPSIDVFLLTTSVGGLGLNLTGADTVIFVEHDWNPMKDLQAMDRAHRIGQKRVVNVYRLITRGTLEEKIMGLQKFKLNIASSIINQDNSGIESMDTNQILDLFSLGGDGKASNEAVDPNKKASTKEILEGLGQLWDEKQYESLDDMSDFLKGLQ